MDRTPYGRPWGDAPILGSPAGAAPRLVQSTASPVLGDISPNLGRPAPLRKRSVLGQRDPTSRSGTGDDSVLCVEPDYGLSPRPGRPLSMADLGGHGGEQHPESAHLSIQQDEDTNGVRLGDSFMEHPWLPPMDSTLDSGDDCRSPGGRNSLWPGAEPTPPPPAAAPAQLSLGPWSRGGPGREHDPRPLQKGPSAGALPLAPAEAAAAAVLVVTQRAAASGLALPAHPAGPRRSASPPQQAPALLCAHCGGEVQGPYYEKDGITVHAGCFKDYRQSRRTSPSSTGRVRSRSGSKRSPRPRKAPPPSPAAPTPRRQPQQLQQHQQLSALSAREFEQPSSVLGGCAPPETGLSQRPRPEPRAAEGDVDESTGGSAPPPQALAASPVLHLASSLGGDPGTFLGGALGDLLDPRMVIRESASEGDWLVAAGSLPAAGASWGRPSGGTVASLPPGGGSPLQPRRSGAAHGHRTAECAVVFTATPSLSISPEAPTPSGIHRHRVADGAVPAAGAELSHMLDAQGLQQQSGELSHSLEEMAGRLHSFSPIEGDGDGEDSGMEAGPGGVHAHGGEGTPSGRGRPNGGTASGIDTITHPIALSSQQQQQLEGDGTRRHSLPGSDHHGALLSGLCSAFDPRCAAGGVDETATPGNPGDGRRPQTPPSKALSSRPPSPLTPVTSQDVSLRAAAPPPLERLPPPGRSTATWGAARELLPQQRPPRKAAGAAPGPDQRRLPAPAASKPPPAPPAGAAPAVPPPQDGPAPATGISFVSQGVVTDSAGSPAPAPPPPVRHAASQTRSDDGHCPYGTRATSASLPRRSSSRSTSRSPSPPQPHGQQRQVEAAELAGLRGRLMEQRLLRLAADEDAARARLELAAAEEAAQQPPRWAEETARLLRDLASAKVAVAAAAASACGPLTCTALPPPRRAPSRAASPALPSPARSRAPDAGSIISALTPRGRGGTQRRPRGLQHAPCGAGPAAGRPLPHPEPATAP
eukprot:TRINITY_DN12709_c1_g3_i1.p1 TRINITY_DN12709_c1_g3~~TRINITY_DN12709_c1_g3_i1.p1  ORF type:complete len:985 (+),score=229.33 TRINITY_DN12709_c1_g3_i1:85-3039(+)